MVAMYTSRPPCMPSLGVDEVLSVAASLHYESQPDNQRSILHKRGQTFAEQRRLMTAILRERSSEERATLASRLALFLGADEPNQKILKTQARDITDSITFSTIFLQFWHESVQELVFHTSGSTGAPVPHRHSLRLFAEEAAAVAPYLECGKRIVSVMPTHHIFGFAFSLMLPQLMGVPIIFLPPIPTEDFFTALRPADVIVAFPLFWQAIATLISGNTPESRDLFPRNLSAITATAPCPREVLETLITHAGMFTLEVYGSTETSALGIRRNNAQAYTVLPTWQPHRQTDGKITLQRTMAEPTRTPVAPPDILEWTDEHCFIPWGRHDQNVQVGGVNVSLERVARVLLKHPGIRECSVRLMHPYEGNRLKAFIVPAAMTPSCLEHLSRPQLWPWIKAHLSTPERPRHVTIGDSLPRNATGKLADWPLTSQIDK